MVTLKPCSSAELLCAATDYLWLNPIQSFGGIITRRSDWSAKAHPRPLIFQRTTSDSFGRNFVFIMKLIIPGIIWSYELYSFIINRNNLPWWPDQYYISWNTNIITVIQVQGSTCAPPIISNRPSRPARGPRMSPRDAKYTAGTAKTRPKARPHILWEYSIQ